MNYGSVAEFFDLQRHRVRRILVKRIGHEILPETGEPVVLTLDELSFRQQDYTLIKMVKRLGFGFRNRQSFLKKALIGCCSQEQIPQLLT